MVELPTVLIYVKGGVVQGVYTTAPSLTYRLVDFDEKDDPQGHIVRDLPADATSVDLESFTQDILAPMRHEHHER